MTTSSSMTSITMSYLRDENFCEKDEDFPEIAISQTAKGDFVNALQDAKINEVVINRLERGCRFDFFCGVERALSTPPLPKVSYTVTSLRDKLGPDHWRVESASKERPVNIVIKDKSVENKLFAVWNSYLNKKLLSVGLSLIGASFTAFSVITALFPRKYLVYDFRGYFYIRNSRAWMGFGCIAAVCIIAAKRLNQHSIKTRFELINKLFTMLAFAATQEDRVNFAELPANASLILQQPDKK